MEYVDLRMKIGPRIGENAYTVSVSAPVAGEANGVFVPPLTDEQLELFVLKVGLARRGVRRIHSTEWRAAQEFGQKLFRALFTDEIRAAYLSGHNDALRHNKGLRLKLTLDAPELANYPWEFLYDPTANQFLALFEDTPILRYVELPRPVLPLTVSLPLRILAVASSPQDYPPLDVANERRNLAHALQQLTDVGLVELDWLSAATLEALREQLLKRAYHIFHFIGHGGFDEAHQDGVLIFEHPNRYSNRVSGERLAVILGNHRTLRLAALNACEGARTSEQDPFAGAAMTLVQTGNLPAVIAMQFEISDDAAIDFASGFYSALASGRPVDAAVSQGRQAIFASGNDVEWSAPVLYLRAADGIIFNVDAELALAQAEKLASQIKIERAPEEKSQTELPPQTIAESSAPAITESEPRAETTVSSRSDETVRAEQSLVSPQGIPEAKLAQPVAAPPMIKSLGALYLSSIGVWAIAFVLPRFFDDAVFSGASFFIGIAAAAVGMYGLFRVSRFSLSRSAVIVMGLGYAAAILFMWFLAAFLTNTSAAIAETLLNPLLNSQSDTVVYFMKDALVMALFGAMVGLLGGAVMLRQLQRATSS